MKEHKTYIVVCKRGLLRNQCPIVQQQGEHCVECPYAVYILREKIKNSEQTEEPTENVES